jgi:VanZ family protein
VKLNYSKISENKFLKKLISIAFYAWIILIFIGCSLPGRELPKLGFFDNFDKVIHFTFFFVLCLLGFIKFGVTKRAIISLMLFAIVYGFSLEFYQLYFVKGRSFDVWDGVADTIGAMCSLFFRKIGTRITWIGSTN